MIRTQLAWRSGSWLQGQGKEHVSLCCVKDVSIHSPRNCDLNNHSIARDLVDLCTENAFMYHISKSIEQVKNSWPFSFIQIARIFNTLLFI